MKKQFDSPKVNNEANQLVRIARLELNQPLEAANAQVWGEGDVAMELFSLLREQTMTAVLANESSPAEVPDDSIDLLFLLSPMPVDQMNRVVAAGGLVLDAATQKSGEWTVFDPAAKYRRIRVISLFR